MANFAKIAVFLMNENQRLKMLIQTLGISQAEFARRLGVSRSLISEYLSGRKRIPDKTLRLISQTFGVSYEWLKEGKGEIWEKRDVQSMAEEIVRDFAREMNINVSEKDIKRIAKKLAKIIEIELKELEEG